MAFTVAPVFHWLHCTSTVQRFLQLVDWIFEKDTRLDDLDARLAKLLSDVELRGMHVNEQRPPSSG